MNILQVMPEFGLAGAETMCESLVKGLVKDSQNKVLVASLYDYHSAITERMEHSGVRVEYLNKKRGFDRNMFGKLARLMKQNNIDVVHTHLYVMEYAIPAAVIAHVPVRIHTVHSVASKEMGKVLRRLSKTFYRHFGVCPVAISPRVADTIAGEYKMSRDDIPVIYNGSDLTKCSPKTSYDYEGSFHLLHVGRLTHIKQQDLIIKAVSKLKKSGRDVKVTFVGAGEMMDDYKRIANSEHLTENDVIFSGLQANVYPFLNEADAFLLPSKYEGMPVSLIEAMGTALPIIASRVGGIPDMIDDGDSGLLIEPTVDNLCDAIIRLMDNLRLRKLLGTRAREKARRFSLEAMAEDYSLLYKKMMKR